jgi:hypothetical protein
MCSIGVSQDVLDASALDPLPFTSFANTDECSYQDYPTLLNKLAFQAIGTNYIHAEVNGEFQCVLFNSPSVTLIPPKTCYALKAYCTWRYLLASMNNSRANNFFIPDSESIYKITFPFLADAQTVYDIFVP